MITAFSVQVPKRISGIRGAINRFRPDRVEVSVESARGVAVKHITYTSFSGEVRLSKAQRAIGTQHDRLLCSDRIIFPHHSGYRRFSSNAFSARMCTNFALKVIEGLSHPERLRLGIFDPDGTAADFMLHSLKYCNSPVIVSDNALSYSLAAKRALDELGAAVSFGRNPLDLSDCDLVVAPGKVGEPLSLREGAVVLCTGGGGSGNVYGKYEFRTPNGFERLRPRELDAEYFCSALYTLGAQYELGSIVPISASNRDGAQTVSSLREMLEQA